MTSLEFKRIDGNIKLDDEPYYMGQHRGYFTLSAPRDYTIPLDTYAILSSGYKAKIPPGYRFRIVDSMLSSQRTYITSHDPANPEEFVDLDCLYYNIFTSYDTAIQETVNISKCDEIMKLYVEKIPESKFALIDSTDEEMKEQIKAKALKEEAEEEANEEYDEI